MSNQKPGSHSYYSSASAVATAAKPQHAVPNSALYKEMRQHELLAYRYVVRTLAMHGTSESTQHRRILEDLREAWCISDDRHEQEMFASSSDPLVAAVLKSQVFANRAPFHDGVTDVPFPDVESDTDDDGGAVVIAKSSVVGGRNGSSSASKSATSKLKDTGMQKSTSGRNVDASASRKAVAPDATMSKLSDEMDTLTADMDAAAKKLVVTRNAEKRVELKRKIEATKEALLVVRTKLLEVLNGQQGSGASDRDPQQESRTSGQSVGPKILFDE